MDENVLAESITAYQDGHRVFLPLGELASVLTLAIRVQPAQGTAEGFVLAEERAFRLNVPQARLVLGDVAQAFDPALVRVEPADIYVESGLLSRWLPVDFFVDLSRLRLRVRARETLPLQARLQRERAGERVAGPRGDVEDPGYPRLRAPYRALSVPFVDQTIGLGVKAGHGQRETTASYTAYATGDLLGLESTLYFSRRPEHPSPEFRYTLGRHDPEAGLLGPLGARTVLFGSGVSAPNVPHVALSTLPGKGHGLTVSNLPFNQPLNFDRHTLEGDLPQGWDVELYYNDALVGFQRSRPDGRYRFEDLPLSYGQNEFRLVFHGPLGQRRVERQTFLLDQPATPPGKVHYALTQHRDDAGAWRSVGLLDIGLTKNLTAAAGWVRLPASGEAVSPPGMTAAAPHPDALYTRVGLRAFWGNVIGSTDLYRSSRGGWLSDTAVKTRIGSVALDYNHLHLDDFASEVFTPTGDPLRMRDKVRLQSVVATDLRWLPRLPVTLELQRDQFRSGRSDLLAGGRLSGFSGATFFSNQLTWQEVSGQRSLLGAFDVSHRVGDLGIAGQVAYTMSPQRRLDTVAISGEKRLGDGYLLHVGVARAFQSSDTIYSASLNKSQGRYGLGLNATYSKGAGFTLGVQLFIATQFEPREGRFRTDAVPKADTGAASVRLFLDNDGNGRMDPGEEGVANAGLTLNGTRLPVRTDRSGTAFLDRLPVFTPLDIAVDVQTLEDPFWQPQRKGIRLTARPGSVASVDFPIVTTSEVDGTVYLQEGAARRGIGNVAIELLDAAGQVVASTKSSADGYYLLAGVTQGEYTVRVAPEQLRQMRLVDPGAKPVSIGPDGKFVGGLDFVLRRQD